MSATRWFSPVVLAVLVDVALRVFLLEGGEGFRGEAIRLALLSGHYRQPLDITRDKIAEAKAQLDRLYGALRQVADAQAGDGAPPDALIAALADDLNTPEALAVLHETAGALNKADSAEKRAGLKAALIAAGGLLGLLERDPEDWFKGPAEGGLSEKEIESLITERSAARKSKDFAAADRIRDELAAQGILLDDGPERTTWKRG